MTNYDLNTTPKVIFNSNEKTFMFFPRYDSSWFESKLNVKNYTLEGLINIGLERDFYVDIIQKTIKLITEENSNDDYIHYLNSILIGII